MTEVIVSRSGGVGLDEMGGGGAQGFDVELGVYEEAGDEPLEARVSVRPAIDDVMVFNQRRPRRMTVFDDQTAQRLEATYQTLDVQAQRRETLVDLDVRHGERILDIGCGPGLLAAELAEAVGTDGRVTAVDRAGYLGPMSAPDDGTVILRPASPDDSKAVAGIWWDGWRDGHLGHVPDELVAVRTAESFVSRAARRVGDTVVAVVGGSVAGFVMVVDDEVEQVYVAARHRGSGVAAVLLAEAERLVRENGHERAWLAVVAGNERARRFYRRHGWADEGPLDYQAAGPAGPISVPTHRYVKPVTGRHHVS